MRFWKVPPRPGSLEEVFATAVEAWDELRNFEYFNALVMATMYSGLNSSEAMEGLTDRLQEIQAKYFTGTTAKKVDTEEADQFRELMENFAVKIGEDAIAPGGLPGQRDEKITERQVFNPAPKGEFLD